MDRLFKEFIRDLTEISSHINDLERIRQELISSVERRKDALQNLADLHNSKSNDDRAFDQALGEFVMAEKDVAHRIKRLNVNYNSIFLHVYVVFERFTYNFLQARLKHGPKVFRDRYLSNYRKRFAMEIEKSSVDVSRLSLQAQLKILAEPNDMIENLRYLGNPVETANMVYSLLNKTIPEDLEIWDRYQEVKERRNALTHRGVKMDETYLTTLKRKIGETSTAFPRKRFDRDGKEIPQSLSCNPRYLKDAVRCIVEISVRLAAKSEGFGTAKDMKDNWHNDFLCQYFLNGLNRHEEIVLESLTTYIERVLPLMKKRQLDSMPFQDKVNYLIILKLYFVDVRKRGLTELRSRDSFKALYSIPSSRQQYIPQWAKRILRAFFKDDKKQYEKALVLAKERAKDSEEWFMTRYLEEPRTSLKDVDTP